MARVPPADRLQRRFPWLGYPLAVVYKYFDDMGPYLASLLTYYTFVSLFPMLLLAATVLSVVLRGHPELQQQLLSSALAEFPVVGSQLAVPSALSGGATGVALGVVTALYGAIGAAQALQYAANTVWQVPRNSRPNPFKARGRSVLLVAVVGLGLMLTTALSTWLTGFLQIGWLAALLVHVLTVAATVLVFALGFLIATERPRSWSAVLPGAVLAAVAWQVLQVVGIRYVQHVIARASASNGVFATVLGMLAFLYLASVVAVLCLEVNAVRVLHLWPRALLTPFTDAVELTEGDERAYRGQTRATRLKGFQQIDVSFEREEQAREDDAPGDKPDDKQ